MLASARSLPLASQREFLEAPHAAAAGESYLRRALEALLDLGRHLAAKGFGLPAVEYKAVPLALREAGVLDVGVTDRFLKMASYRNRLTHFYNEVAPEELYAILRGQLGEVEEVLAMLLRWVEEHPERIDRSL